MNFVLLFALIIIFVGINSLEYLNCDFKTDCCWHSKLSNSNKPQIHNSSIDKHFYSRTFRTGSRHQPPKSSYLQLTAGKAPDFSIWESCEICSTTGFIEVIFRHWQSPTTILELCWRSFLKNESDSEAYCIKIDPYSQFRMDPFTLKTISNKPINLYFRLKNRSTNGRQAIVIIDYIQVLTDVCPLTVHNLLNNSNESPINNKINEEHISSVEKLENPKKNLIIKSLQISSNSKEFPNDFQKANKNILFAVPLFVPNTNSNEENFQQNQLNPLEEALGKDFINFLDPGFNTTKYEIFERISENEQKVTSIKSNPECYTRGGCLFEKNTCEYVNSPTVTTNEFFQRVQLAGTYFAEARIRPGEYGVFESTTNMTDQNYYLLFDYLKWVQPDPTALDTMNSESGEKLSVCCFVPQRSPFELDCPFETPLNENRIDESLKWKPAKVLCPQGTTKLVFICENYGPQNLAICAIDNVRLHSENDVDFVYPCQQKLLSEQLL